MRNDIHGAPFDGEEQFLAKFGKNPYGENVWRLVPAQYVFWKIGGEFKIWDKNLEMNERGGFSFEDDDSTLDYKMGAAENKPIRVDVGVFEKPRYPEHEGWILQKWMPASKYPKDVWYSPQACLIDGTPLLGPYPETGDYELIFGPNKEKPTQSQMRQWIASHYRFLDHQASVSFETRMNQRQAAQEEEERQQDLKMSKFIEEYRRDKCFYMDKVSLGAGRIRSEKAQALGIKEHVGN